MASSVSGGAPEWQPAPVGGDDAEWRANAVRRFDLHYGVYFPPHEMDFFAATIQHAHNQLPAPPNEEKVMSVINRLRILLENIQIVRVRIGIDAPERFYLRARNQKVQVCVLFPETENLDQKLKNLVSLAVMKAKAHPFFFGETSLRTLNENWVLCIDTTAFIRRACPIRWAYANNEVGTIDVANEVNPDPQRRAL